MKLRYYIIRRLLLLVVVLIGISTITFTLTRVIPSEPALMWVGPHATPEQIEKTRIELGLDKPLYVQYSKYFWDLLHGDLGVSIRTHKPVLDDLLTFLPASLELITVAMIMGVLIGVSLGVICARRKDTFVDHFGRIFAISGVSLPAFWIAMVFQLVFFKQLGILPPAGRIDTAIQLTSPITRITGFYLIDSLITGNWTAFQSALAHIILPAFTLALYPIGLFMRITRTSMIDVLGEDYIRTSKAYGISDRIITYLYALKNAIGPTITVLVLTFGYSLTGTFLIEAVFNFRGLGWYASQSIISMDYPAIMGVALVVAFFYVIANLIVDIVHAYLDPRIVLR